MKKSTFLKVLCGTALAAVLIVSVLAIIASRTYMGCASRIVSGASPTDASPPAAYRRLSRAFWQHRDLFLARVLARECAGEARGSMDRLQREALALGIVKAQISPAQRETLGAILIPAHDGRGLTHSAQTEWRRPPGDLNESEMTWLFVVGQRPDCSKQRALSEPDRQACEDLYQGLVRAAP